ncbi:MAG: aspartate-semialdehyde dehydrogenase [Gammaproteobacteria bacterium]|uniref:Aspartate-semialdehyde dehydrogenase n=1 Tax=OM182 bacterium TaxID=2510334 RepID=A0A520S0S6_9GAMM|nr:aspartate-semialdehyde dehydrogenase [Gammaproteobacteria bacterium]OUV67310.1 MAG: aspartate-semialdehyde dehydrogenase [Gammaproteobacteria bacterium TMED133]RZO76076.1 MAG: aspartate-semialdehyde dehydrogenase [OM182 bacterium]
MDGYNVAVVGATGAVGEAMIQILEQRQFPIKELFLLASERSAGARIQFKGKSVSVKDLENFDFSQAQIGLFSAGGSVSAEYAPQAGEAGCVVIDNTSCFRRDEEVPLIVPEVNAHAIENYRNKNIIANPNCSTIQMLVALKPIYDAVGISRINVSTYQAVSGAGRGGIEELASQTADLLNAKPIRSNVFTKQISFNAIPHIGDFLDNGFTLEEMKMVWETQKIFEDHEIQVNPTCVRIPVFYGHSEALHIETCSKISVQEVVELLSISPGVHVIDEMGDGGYPTAVTDSAGEDGVFVGRIREDLSLDRGLDLWVVSDNVRKGAALNSVQIAEILTEYL